MTTPLGEWLDEVEKKLESELQVQNAWYDEIPLLIAGLRAFDEKHPPKAPSNLYPLCSCKTCQTPQCPECSQMPFEVKYPCPSRIDIEKAVGL